MAKISEELKDYLDKTSDHYHMTKSGMIEMCIEIHMRMGHETALKLLRLAGKRVGKWPELKAWLDDQDLKRNQIIQ